MQPEDEIYFNREQSAVKQYVLKEYLLPFALIVGTWKDIAYVDCCAGPWQSRAEGFTDTSFAIAINVLKQAKAELLERGRPVNVCCLFIEEDPTAFNALKSFCRSESELSAIPLEGDFTKKVAEIKSFLAQHKNPFPFFFIDPKGWKPIRISAIKPILQINPGEVLINFMTSHIRRFLNREGLDFDALLGSGNASRISNLHGSERDEAAVFTYASEVKKAGSYDYVSTTVVPNPNKAQAHFHLIYGTRSWKGIEKFKEAEKRAFGFAATIRKNAQRRIREERSSQPEFRFEEDGGRPHEAYMEQLRARFLNLAKERLLEEIDSGRNSTYRSLIEIYLRRPLVWESDFRMLLGELQDEKVIEIKDANRKGATISDNAVIKRVKH